MGSSDETGGQVPRRYESGVGVRKPCVLLVRIEERAERELALPELFVRVLRTRHPLQACHRMGIVRPLVVVIGASVRSDDVELLEERAAMIGAEVLPLGQLVARAELRKWMRRALEIAMARRAGATARSGAAR